MTVRTARQNKHFLHGVHCQVISVYRCLQNGIRTRACGSFRAVFFFFFLIDTGQINWRNLYDTAWSGPVLTFCEDFFRRIFREGAAF